MSDEQPDPPADQPDPSRAPRVLPIDWESEPTPAYANGAQVVHTPREFALLFTDMTQFPGRHATQEQPGEPRATISASLRMTPDTYFQVLCVLASNWNKFANEHIDPRMRRPRFKLLDAGELQLEGLPKRERDE